MTFTPGTVRCPGSPPDLRVAWGTVPGGTVVEDRNVRRGRRRWTSVAVVAALGVFVAMSATACDPPRKESRAHPVLLIHGWGLGADTDCGSTFDRMIGQMKSEGFTGPFIRVGFYSGDTNCDMSLRSWGTSADPVEDGSHFSVLSKAFSKYVYATFTAKGKTVDVVGYSMGGNIVRGAIQGAQGGEAGFSAPIMVQDVVTFGAPMNGAAWYSSFCLWGMCSSLKPGSDDVKWLNRNGNPQGVGGTEFTAYGSSDDAVTPLDSAVHIDIPEARKHRLSGVPHTGSDNYMGRADVVKSADDALAKPDV
jgi:hypothetical protein